MEVTITRIGELQRNLNLAVMEDENVEMCLDSLKDVSEDIESIMEKDKSISEITIKFE